MPASQAKNKKLGLAVLALVCFFNPCIGIVDLLPDCIGAFLFVYILKHAAELSPYFAESRSAFLKLAICDLIKFFCQFSVMGQSTVGIGDISAMLSITFLVLDTVFFFIAAKYLFDGLFYLGERSDAQALYAPFPVFRANGVRLDPEHLKTFTFVFFALKSLLAALPELLRLSTDPMNESASDLTRYYPTAVLISVTVASVIGIAWLYLALRFRRAIRREGRVSAALRDRLSAEELVLYEERVRRHTFRIAGYLLIFASVFLMTVRLEDYGGLNIFPSFLLPLLLLLSFHTTVPYLQIARRGRLVVALCTVISLGAFIMQAIFFEDHTFVEIPNNDRAAALYEAVKWTSLAEAVAISAVLLTLYICLSAFIREYTVCDAHSSAYTAIDRDYQRALRKSSRFALLFLFLTAAARCADVFFRGEVTTFFTNPNNPYSGDTITAGLFPWFSTVATVMAVLSVLITVFLVSRLKDAYLLRFPNSDENA